MTNTTNSEQIEIWKSELSVAMTDGQWQLALKLCGWLRYELRQLELSDSEVKISHDQAKEALSKQLIQEKSSHTEHQQQQSMTMRQIRFGEWDLAFDSIETLYQDGANRLEAISLFQEIEVRTQTFFSSNHRKTSQRAANLGKRFDELAERIGWDPLKNRNKSHF
ncbi:MAG: hypothetical protein ISR58_10410 [Anaerolineales bacterium]|nr:hypothetical protein [Chloroflexota bacterium]MBL6981586.1 hypothetical protein [Anaerolineales bacterium]